jgi:hypothetical protein
VVSEKEIVMRGVPPRENSRVELARLNILIHRAFVLLSERGNGNQQPDDAGNTPVPRDA